MKNITRQNWKTTTYNKNGDTRRINITRSTPHGSVHIKGFIKNNYVTEYSKGSMVFLAPGYTNALSVELFDIKPDDFDRMFSWTEEFLKESFESFLK